MDIDGNEVVHGERSSSSSGNAHDVGHSGGTKRAREDDVEDLDERLAQQRLAEIDGPKREREQAESDEESAKRTRLNIEQSKPLNALRNCSGRKKNDERCSTYDVVELFSSLQVTARARQRGLRGGWSLSKTVVDPITGRTWDLLNPKDVKGAWNLFFQTQPKLLVTFPPAEPDGGFMIGLAIDMCLAQAKAVRYFAFECAELVNCRHLPCMLRLYCVQNAPQNCLGHRHWREEDGCDQLPGDRQFH